MSRRKVQHGHANHDRWLVSYADFITLMFAFFVVMFASSQADRSKVKQVSESVTKALDDGPASRMRAAVAEMLGAKADPKVQPFPVSLKGLAKGPAPTGIETPKPAAAVMAGELLPSLAYLEAQLKKEIESGKMRISLEPRGLVVSLQQATFFPSGEDTLAPATYSSLEKVAIAMRKLPNPVRLEGHTDAIPIHTARFRSNWELSAARAIAVLDLLTGRFEIPRERLAIAGYADTAPLAANDSEAGRARNRRVDIVILSHQQALTEPMPAATAAALPPAMQAGRPQTIGVPHAPM